MLFFEKENVFMCLVAFQKMFWKIFSGIWLCSWKYHRKHIFYLLLTFSWLPNEYIISFLPQYRNTNKTQKKNHQIRSHFLTFSLLPNEYIIPFIPQYKHKQNPEKKSTNPVKLREEGRERERQLGSTRGEIARRGAAIAIGAKARSRSARCCNDQTRSKGRGRSRKREIDSAISLLRLWVVLSLSLSPFARLWAPLFACLNSRSDLKVK